MSALAVVPDGRWLAAGSHNGTVWIFGTAAWEQRATLEGHSGPVGAALVLAVAPDGSWLATGGGDDGTARVWDPVSGGLLATLKGHDAWCRCWPWRRTADGWLPQARITRSGSGIRSAGCNRRRWKVIAGRRRWWWRRVAAGWPRSVRTGRSGSGIRSAGGGGPRWQATGSRGWLRSRTGDDRHRRAVITPRQGKNDVIST